MAFMITFSSSPNCSRLLAATPEPGEAAAVWTGQHERFRRKELSEFVSPGRAYFPVVFLGGENRDPEESACVHPLLWKRKPRHWRGAVSICRRAGRAGLGREPGGALPVALAVPCVRSRVYLPLPQKGTEGRISI